METVYVYNGRETHPNDTVKRRRHIYRYFLDHFTLAVSDF